MTPSSNLVPGVAVQQTVFELATKQEVVGDERPGNSSRDLRKPKDQFTQHHVAARGIHLSGNQVLLGLATAFCLTGGLVWVFVRYLLFAQ